MAAEIVFSNKELSESDFKKYDGTVNIRIDHCTFNHNILFDELDINELSISYSTFKNVELSNIIFRNEIYVESCTFESLTINDCDFIEQLYLKNCNIKKSTMIFDSTLRKDTFLTGSVFNGLQCKNDSFYRGLYFSENYETPRNVHESSIKSSKFNDILLIENCNCSGIIVLSGCNFSSDVKLSKSVFENDVILSIPQNVCVRTESESDFIIDSCMLKRNLFMYGSKFSHINILFSKIIGNLMMSHRTNYGPIVCDMKELSVLESRFENDVVVYGSKINGDVTFNNVSIGGDLMLSRLNSDDGPFIPSEISGTLTIDHCNINGQTELQQCILHSGFEIKSCEFGRDVSFMSWVSDNTIKTSIRGPSLFSECNFNDRLELYNVIFKENISFNKCTFNKTVLFSKVNEKRTELRSCTFEGSFSMNSCIVKKLFYIMGCKFEKDANMMFNTFEENVMFSTTIENDGIISFHGSIFNGQFDLSESVFLNDLSMYASVFNSKAILSNIKIGKDLVLTRVRADKGKYTETIFNDTVDFKYSEFNGLVHMERTIFHKDVFFDYSKFNKEVYLSNVVQKSSATGRSDRFNIGDMSDMVDQSKNNVDNEHMKIYSEFNDYSSFSHSIFNSDVLMYCCKFKKVDFKNALFKSNVYFDSSPIIGEDRSFSAELDDADFSGAKFNDICYMNGILSKTKLNFDHTIFDNVLMISTLKSSRATVNTICFNSATFNKEAIFKDMKISDGMSFDNSFINGSLDFDSENYAGKISFDNSKIFGALSVNSKGVISFRSSTIIGAVKISNRYSTIDLSGIKLSGQLDLDWDYLTKEKFKHMATQDCNIFRSLKENYSRIGKYHEEDRAYEEYKKRSNSGKGVKNRANSTMGKLFRIIGGYGTRPLSIAITMVAIIFIFSIIYSFVPGIDLYSVYGEEISYLDNLYFSTATFLTMGLTEYSPVGATTRIIMITEGFLGLFFIFYFTLACARKLLR